MNKLEAFVRVRSATHLAVRVVMRTTNGGYVVIRDRVTNITQFVRGAYMEAGRVFSINRCEEMLVLADLPGETILISRPAYYRVTSKGIKRISEGEAEAVLCIAGKRIANVVSYAEFMAEKKKFNQA